MNFCSFSILRNANVILKIQPVAIKRTTYCRPRDIIVLISAVLFSQNNLPEAEALYRDTEGRENERCKQCLLKRCLCLLVGVSCHS